MVRSKQARRMKDVKRRGWRTHALLARIAIIAPHPTMHLHEVNPFGATRTYSVLRVGIGTTRIRVSPMEAWTEGLLRLA